MAQKPNYVSITIVCGRCRETIMLPSDYAIGICETLRTISRNAYQNGDINLERHALHRASLASFDVKYTMLYGEEE